MLQHTSSFGGAEYNRVGVVDKFRNIIPLNVVFHANSMDGAVFNPVGVVDRFRNIIPLSVVLHASSLDGAASNQMGKFSLSSEIMNPSLLYSMPADLMEPRPKQVHVLV